MVKNIRELKVLLNEVMPDGYKYYIDYGLNYFQIEIDHYFIVSTRFYDEEDTKCEFVLEVKELDDYLTYEDLTLITNVIAILNNNMDFVLSKLRKLSEEELNKKLEEHDNTEKELSRAIDIYELFCDMIEL